MHYIWAWFSNFVDNPKWKLATYENRTKYLHHKQRDGRDRVLSNLIKYIIVNNSNRLCSLRFPSPVFFLSNASIMLRHKRHTVFASFTVNFTKPLFRSLHHCPFFFTLSVYSSVACYTIFTTLCKSTVSVEFYSCIV